MVLMYVDSLQGFLCIYASPPLHQRLISKANQRLWECVEYLTPKGREGINCVIGQNEFSIQITGSRSNAIAKAPSAMKFPALQA